jgi:hypothetical protein
VLIFLAIFIVWFLSWKVVSWLRNGMKSDGRAANGGHMKPGGRHMETRGRHMQPQQEPTGSWDEAISRPLDCSYGSEWGDLGGMTRREQEELFSIYGPGSYAKP